MMDMITCGIFKGMCEHSGQSALRVDVGGTVFKTTLETLTNLDGRMKELLVRLDNDQTGIIFIDRSPKHFEVILNYMRDESVELPNSMEDLRQILKEAEYFELDGLIELCKSKIPDRSYDINFIENDNDLLEIITSPERTVLIFYYPVTPHGKVRYPEDLDAKSFLEKYDDNFDIYFKPYKMGRSDREEWLWSLHKGNDRADFKYHKNNFPKQDFMQLFEESIKGF
uniref:BTB domain-containing protein n=1 Tax=Caenorhabditis tropicalis TaxID=1561998 RepID=A0A1I7TCJ9_9PELO